MKLRSVIFASVLFAFCSCSSDKEEGPFISDDAIYSLLKSSTFSFFKRSTDTLTPDPASPHFAFIRVGLNQRAQSAMDDSLRFLQASEFPDESMVIKEVYDTKGGPLQVYAVMYKVKGASNSGAGWVWNEYNADGSVIYSASRKGDQCISCHSSGNHSDLVRTFSLH